jgi:hypothetical protein
MYVIIASAAVTGIVLYYALESPDKP